MEYMNKTREVLGQYYYSQDYYLKLNPKTSKIQIINISYNT